MSRVWFATSVMRSAISRRPHLLVQRPQDVRRRRVHALDRATDRRHRVRGVLGRGQHLLDRLHDVLGRLRRVLRQHLHPSFATTAKPAVRAPARRLDRGVERARRFVWRAMRAMSDLTTDPITPRGVTETGDRLRRAVRFVHGRGVNTASTAWPRSSTDLGRRRVELLASPRPRRSWRSPPRPRRGSCSASNFPEARGVTTASSCALALLITTAPSRVPSRPCRVRMGR